jgi:alanine racemase
MINFDLVLLETFIFWDSLRMWTWLEISKSALVHNATIFRKLLGSEKTALVVKSNAYGHGLKEVYEALKSLNMPILCVNYLLEGSTLRSLGYKGRIMIVGPFVNSDIKKAHDIDAELFLGHQEGLDAWISAKHKPKLHIEIDTGMSRQGFSPAAAGHVAKQLVPFQERVVGLCMHFANVEDVTEHSYADVQLSHFLDASKQFEAYNFILPKHAASSASALILDVSHFDLSRVGISLYGLWPSLPTKISYSQLHGSDVLGLKPALSWRCPITSINEIAAGQYIGYGCTFKARKPMRIAVLPVGYYEGYPRLSSGNPAYVLIAGERCPIVGRICMNMMMVDITDMPKIAVGSSVTLIGQDGSEYLSASDVAAWAQTIHYELVTRLHPEIPRKLVE